MTLLTSAKLKELQEGLKQASGTPMDKAITGTLTATKEALAFSQLLISGFQERDQ